MQGYATQLLSSTIHTVMLCGCMKSLRSKARSLEVFRTELMESVRSAWRLLSRVLTSASILALLYALLCARWRASSALRTASYRLKRCDPGPLRQQVGNRLWLAQRLSAYCGPTSVAVRGKASCRLLVLQSARHGLRALHQALARGIPTGIDWAQFRAIGDPAHLFLRCQPWAALIGDRRRVEELIENLGPRNTCELGQRQRLTLHRGRWARPAWQHRKRLAPLEPGSWLCLAQYAARDGHIL
eukprot:scaffold248538_cov35-Tisochrysis_lutea.AAC.1